MSGINNEEIELLVKNDDDNKKNEAPVNNAASNKKERLYWVDGLRIFPAYSVIFIHCADVDIKPMELFSSEWKAHYFYFSILKPCVPIFVMITGLFFLDPNKKITLGSIYSKSITRLLKGFAFWSLYYNAVDELFINEFSRPPTDFWSRVGYVVKYTILGGNRNHIWYINFCIGLYMMAPIFRELISKKQLAWYVALLSVLFYQLLPTIGDLFITFKFLPDVGQILKAWVNTFRIAPVSNHVNYLCSVTF